MDDKDINDNDNNVVNYDVNRKNILRDRIVEKLTKTYGDSNRKNIDRYFDRRYEEILFDLATTYFNDIQHDMFPNDTDVKMYLVSEKRKLWGMITINNERKEAVDLLLPYFTTELYKGSQGTAKAIKMRDITVDALMELAIEETEFTTFKREFVIPEGTEYLSTPIDVENLRNYMNTLTWKIQHTGNQEEKNKFIREKLKGQAILTNLNSNKELDQEVIIADSGRIYLKGINLLNSPKTLRHAALGTCHLYDMRAGAFGILAALAQTYAKAQGIGAPFSHIKGYIKYKEQYRMKITKYVYPVQCQQFKDISDYKKFYGYYNIKVALTSIGFGAKRNHRAVWRDANNHWKRTSILDAFKGNQAELSRFLDCKIVQELTDEYAEASKIVQYMIETEENFSNRFNFTNADKPAEKIALVYQHIEQEILMQFINNSNVQVLLPAHDGVYIKHAIDYTNVWSTLEHDYIDDMSFIQFDHTKYISDIQATTSLQTETNHKLFMEELEEEAKEYYTCR